MNKREYLRSLGFEVGKRGRFSAEMLKALEGFDEGTESKIDSVLDEIVIDTPVKFEIKSPLPRTDGVTMYTAVLKAGQIVNFDTCPQCKNSVIYCHCVNPSPPKWLVPEVASWSAAG